ncbi:cell cycle control protein [Zalerion maritima]|uniref:Cell cycle control protein n=1 Tax=Zalerion maritima TaxID=339359 RepID=A0AAD5RUD0_9PEZI|nr:cell cycle control protein [Zalerion maritima]
MASLEEFERQLAEEKKSHDREEERRHRKHRHREDRHHRHHDRSRERRHGDDGDDGKRRHHRRRDDDHEDDRRHRHKRRREHQDDDGPAGETSEAPAVSSASDGKETGEKLVRDSWMTAPSALDIDYVHRGEKRPPTPPPAPKLVVHERELNVGHHGNISKPAESKQEEHTVDYTFGDDGSSWRMMKLKAVYRTAEETGQTADLIAEERFGSLRAFDDAREEKIEVDRRRTYGKGYAGKDKPTGELYKERLAKEASRPPRRQHEPKSEPEPLLEAAPTTTTAPSTSSGPPDQNTLNKLKAQIMRAKLRKDPNLPQLEAQYEAAQKGHSTTISSTGDIVIGAMESRLLAGTRGEVQAVTNRRGRERGNVEENTDMSINDMVREERRTRNQAGGEGMCMAERIAKDGRFDNDLEYMDENAENLARRVHKSEINLKNMAVSEYQKVSRILDSCPLCHHEEKDPPSPIAPVVSLGMRTYLTLATEPEISDGTTMIVPLAHHKNLVECDDDEWEEMRNFMKSLTRLYHERGQEVIFYENAAHPHRHPHAALVAVPIPYELGATAPAFFKEAILTQDEEWSQHAKLIDTGKKAREGMGRMAFRRSLAKEMPYFHVWFDLDGGLGHVVEDEGRWPKGDLFAREVIGGMVDAMPDVIKRQGRWRKDGDREKERMERFRKAGWRKFDWTRVLAEGATQ